MKKYIIIAIIIVILLIGYKFILRPYNENIERKYKILNSLERDTLDTYVGKIEYTIKGKGTPVLISHGILGGCNQGILFGDYLFGENFKTIAVSRYGYLGASLPINPSPTTQANAYKQLLDSLNIDKVIMVGIGTGGPTALKFTQDFAERTKALILLNSPVVDKRGKHTSIVPPKIILNDFLFYVVEKFNKEELVEIVGGINKDYYKNMDINERQRTDSIIKAMRPLKPRKRGVKTDEKVIKRVIKDNYGNINLKMVLSPTLIFHTKDNSLITTDKAHEINNLISNSELVEFSKGGRFNLGNLKEMKNRIANF